MKKASETFDCLPVKLRDERERVFKKLSMTKDELRNEDVCTLLNLLEKLVLYCWNDDELTMDVGHLVIWVLFSYEHDPEIKKLCREFSELELPERHAVDTHRETKKNILSLISEKRELLLAYKR